MTTAGNLCLLPLLVAAFVCGCASPNTAWFAEQRTLHCLETPLDSCLPDFAEAQIAKWHQSETAIDAPGALADLIIASALLSPPTSIVWPPERADLTAAHSAAKALASYVDPFPDDALADLQKIEPVSLRARTLLFAWLSMHSSIPEHHSAAILNTLYEHDRQRYALAQALRLPGLLLTGDLERASAMRDEILEITIRSENSSSVLAFICGVYAAAGYEADAVSLLRRSIETGATVSEDDLQLIRLLTRVGKGDYPLPQDFYFFESDAKRVEAYTVMARVTHGLGMHNQSKQALRDGLKLIQKTSFQADFHSSLTRIILASVATRQL